MKRELRYWKDGEKVNGRGLGLLEHAAAVVSDVHAERVTRQDRAHATIAAELRDAVAVGVLEANLEPEALAPNTITLNRTPPSGFIGEDRRPVVLWRDRALRAESELLKLRLVLGRQSERIAAFADALHPPVDGLLGPGSPITIEKPAESTPGEIENAHAVLRAADNASVERAKGEAVRIRPPHLDGSVCNLDADCIDNHTGGVVDDGYPCGCGDSSGAHTNAQHKIATGRYDICARYLDEWEIKSGHRQAPCKTPDCDGRCYEENLFICRLCGQAESELDDTCPKAGAP